MGARRSGTARFLNLIVPGSGLIISQREWFGLTLALLFGVCSQIALGGWLIAPAAIPLWLTFAAAVMAALVWVAAQVLLHHHLGVFNHPQRGEQIARFLDEARAAVNHGDRRSALLLVEAALSLDDECLDTCVERARLLSRLGPAASMNRAWRRVAALDTLGRYRDESIAALRGLAL